MVMTCGRGESYLSFALEDGDGVARLCNDGSNHTHRRRVIRLYVLQVLTLTACPSEANLQRGEIQLQRLVPVRIACPVSGLQGIIQHFEFEVHASLQEFGRCKS